MVVVVRPRSVPASSFPDATNTGYTGELDLVDPSPAIFTTLDTPDAVVENKHFLGSVVFDAANITLRNCKVENNSGSNFACIAMSEDGLGCTIEDCEIDGVGPSFDTGFGIGMQTGTTVRRCNIHHVENAVSSGQDNLTIEDNYMHDLDVSGASPHYDGVQSDGGHTNWVIRHNTIICPDQTSAIFIANNNGATDSVLIENNLLVGGTYTIYVDDQFNVEDITNVTVQGNRFGAHTFDYYFIRTPGATIVFTNNVDDATGDPIPEAP